MGIRLPLAPEAPDQFGREVLGPGRAAAVPGDQHRAPGSQRRDEHVRHGGEAGAL